MNTKKLGDRLRQRRLELHIGLREAASKLKISPTYLSRIETGKEESPPTENLLRAMTELLSEHFDGLMSLAGRIPSDVTAILLSDSGWFEFLRAARKQNISAEGLQEMCCRERITLGVEK